jgi:hypothetical protein
LTEPVPLFSQPFLLAIVQLPPLMVMLAELGFFIIGKCLPLPMVFHQALFFRHRQGLFIGPLQRQTQHREQQTERCDPATAFHGCSDRRR